MNSHRDSHGGDSTEKKKISIHWPNISNFIHPYAYFFFFVGKANKKHYTLKWEEGNEFFAFLLVTTLLSLYALQIFNKYS